MRQSLSLMMVVSFLFTTFCYDDSFIREKLKNHEERISELESLCLKMNTNISSLQAVLDALQKNDYVTSMVLTFESGNLIVNDYTIYDIPWDITGNYLFSSYYTDSDDGKYVDYSGIGEGTKLYYAKMWDDQGRLIYIGYPDKDVNPATGNMEYCWTSRTYSSSSGTMISKNEFAYYNSALSEYVPYGGNF